MTQVSVAVPILFTLFASFGARADDPPKLNAILNVCGAVEAELTPIQKPADFANLSFTLLDPDGSSVNVNVSAITSEGFVDAAKLELPAGKVIRKGFFVMLRQGNAIHDIKPVPATPDTILFDATRRSDLEVTFPCDVVPKTISVAISRDEKAVSGLSPRIILERSSARIVMFRLNTSLRHEDTVTVTARTSSNQTATVEADVDFEAPADIDSATIYVGGNVEVAEDAKPKLLIDLKYDGRKRPVGDSIRWTHGPSLLVDAATQDADGEGKGTAGYGFRYLDYMSRKDADGNAYFILTRTDLTAAFEADDGLNTRNVIGDIQHQWQFPGKKWNVRPAIGVEGGTNLAQKTKLEEFSDYNILRPTFDFFLSRKFEDVGLFKEISFSIDTQSRYLLEDEPDVEQLPKSEQTEDTKTKTVVNDGFKFYGKASLTIGLSENVGIAFEYEVGEQPPLYGENNKGSVAIVYAF